MVEQVLIELDMVPPDVIISPALQPVFVWCLESVVCRSHDVGCFIGQSRERKKWLAPDLFIGVLQRRFDALLQAGTLRLNLPIKVPS
jgi:hypothetical protein